ncbi:MAG: four helix bundle suffix domain-containing protein [bacterium]|nr:four helix bundle suffix domain-containing protein [bacterium]
MNTDEHGQARTDEGLIPKHGGYRKLKTFQLSTLIYDVTVLFCDKFIERRSRTHDQMVQAARSGRQNIAEGSVDSATSKKMEMKLTGVAKGSLEELRLDEFRAWVADEVRRAKEGKAQTTDGHGQTRTESGAADADVRGGSCPSVALPAVLAANGALSLLNLCIYLLDRQLAAQAAAFERDGGFTERLYRQRTFHRQQGTQ